MVNLDALKQELMQSNPAFRQLVAEHQECERKLQALHQKTLLDQEDEVQEKQIKVHKLALKDQMERLLREHRDSRVPV